MSSLLDCLKGNNSLLTAGTTTVTWHSVGSKTVTVQAANAFGVVEATHPVTVAAAATNITPGQAATLIYTGTDHIITRVDFPANSVTEPIAVGYFSMTATVETPFPVQPVAPPFAVTAYRAQQAVDNYELTRPAHLTIGYQAADPQEFDERLLQIHTWDGTAWVNAATTCHPPTAYTPDTDNNTVSIGICRLGQFALLEGPRQLFMPLITR